MVFGFGRRERYIELAEKAKEEERIKAMLAQQERKEKKTFLKKIPTAEQKVAMETERIKAGKKIFEKRRGERFKGAGAGVGASVREFGRRAPVEDFSFHEEVIRQTFGHGEHIWGTKMNPVELNHDLNPRQRGENETARMFGFGDD